MPKSTAAVQRNLADEAGTSRHRTPEPGASLLLDVVAATAFFALLTGWIESVYWLAKKHVFGQLTFMPSEVFWMAPMGYLLIFAIPGIVLALFAHCIGRRPFVWDAVRLLSLLAALGLVLLFGGKLHIVAQLLLAGGIAAATVRFLQRSSDRSRYLIRVGAVAMSVALLVATGLQHMLPTDFPLASRPSLDPKPPNVLLMVLDTVRADHLGCHGATPSPTPQLDRWARKGVVFEQAISTAPWTLPSTASMFTGRLPREMSADWFERLDERFPTLAEYMRQNGYQTAGFVANTRYCGAEVGVARGFTHYEDHDLSLANVAMCTALGRRFASSFLSCRVGCRSVPGRKTAGTITKTFLRWLTGRDHKPYFVFLNFLDAHDPYIAPEPFDGHWPTSYEQRLKMRFWWWMRKQHVTRDFEEKTRQAYTDCIRYLDEQVGKLLDALEAQQRLENTLIIITADHGEQFGEHGLYLHGNSLYQELVHVPLLMIWRDHLPAGLRVKGPVSLSSLPVTVAELTSQARGPFPGVSFFDVWDDERTDGKSRPVFSEVLSPPEHAPCQGRSPVFRGSMVAVRQGRFKLISNGDSLDELYDVVADPKEGRNLIDEPGFATIVDELRRLSSKD